MTKQVLWLGTAVMTTLLALLVLWQFRIVVVYVLVSLALAAAVRPWVERWARQGLLVRLALILLGLVVLSSFGFLLFFASLSALSELQQLGRAVSVQDEWRLPVWLKNSTIQQLVLTRLPSPGDLFQEFTGEQGQLVLPALLGITQGLAGIVSGGLVIGFLSL